MLRDTIRHDPIARSILAYLATREPSTRLVRIIQYMELMHYATPECTRTTIARLANDGLVERVQRGWYRRRWDIV